MAVGRRTGYWDSRQKEKVKESKKKLLGVMPISIWVTLDDITRLSGVTKATAIKRLPQLEAEEKICSKKKEGGKGKLYRRLAFRAVDEKRLLELGKRGGCIQIGNPKESTITKYFYPDPKGGHYYDLDMADSVRDNFLRGTFRYFAKKHPEVRDKDISSVINAWRNEFGKEAIILFQLNMDRLSEWLKTDEGKTYLKKLSWSD